MMTIYLKDLIVEGKHGHHPHEKEKPQRFKINLELTADNDKAGVSDELEDTVDWSWVRDVAISAVQNNSFNLIERLAKEIGDQMLTDKKVKSIIVSVDKLEAFDNGIPGVKIELENS